MSEKIELGDIVRCKYSGFTGTAVARSEFINGCVQYSVIPRHSKSKQFIPPEEQSMDEQSLEVVSKNKDSVEKESVGGAIRKGIKQRGF